MNGNVKSGIRALVFPFRGSIVIEPSHRRRPNPVGMTSMAAATRADAAPLGLVWSSSTVTINIESLAGLHVLRRHRAVPAHIWTMMPAEAGTPNPSS